MADLNLQATVEILIKGLSDLGALGQRFLEVSRQAEGLGAIGAAFDEIERKSKSAGVSVASAFDSIGARSFGAIAEDLAKANAELDAASVAAREAGLSFGTLTAAEEQAIIKIADLNAELANPQIKSFNDRLSTLVTTVSSVGRAFDGLVSTGTTDLKSLDEAVRVLGARSFGEITAEIAKVKLALESVKGSGASFEEIARAEQLVALRLQDLNSELASVSGSAKVASDAISAAFAGGAGIAEVEAAILDVNKALQTVKDGDVGFKSLAAAEELAANKLQLLTARMAELKAQATATQQSLNDAFGTLGGRSAQQITEQINRVKAALDSVKGSGASFEEVARAEQLAEARLKALNAELTNPAPKSFGAGLDEIVGKLRGLDFEGAKQSVGALYDSLGNIAKLTAAGVAIGLVTKAVGALASEVKEAALYAAKVDTLAISLDVVARNAGYSAAQLGPLETQFKKLGITTEATRQSLLQMIQAGINITALSDATTKTGEKLTVAGELARRAQDLAVVSGENSSQTLQRLTLNIQQMDTQGLKFMGLIVNREAAMEKFAAKLGTVASALTPTQEKQAFLNATMEEARKLEGAYESALESVGKKLSSLQRYQDEYTYSLGKNFQPALLAIVNAYTEFLDKGQKIIENFNATSNTASDLGDAIAPLANAIKDIALIAQTLAFDAFVSAVPVVKELVGVFDILYTQVKDTAKAFVSLFDDGTKESQDFLAKLDPINGFFLALRIAVAAVSDGVRFLIGSFDIINAKAQLGVAAVLRLAAAAERPFSSTIADGLVKSAEGYERSSKILEEAGNRNIKTLSDGQGALGRLVDGYGQVDQKANQATVTAKAFSGIISNLNQAQRDGSASSQALTVGYNGVSEALNKAVASGQLSKKEFGELTKQLNAIPETFASRFSEASSQAKISLSQLRTDVSTEVSTSLNLLGLLIEGAATKDKATIESMGSTLKTIGADVINVYDKLVGSTKTLSDLVLVDQKLVDARKNGVVTEAQYAQALQTTAAKFDQLVAAGLKAAQTRTDFEKITESVTKLGEQGAISGTKLIDTFKTIAAQAGTRLNLDLVRTELTSLEQKGKLSGEQVAQGMRAIADEARTSTAEVKKLSEQAVSLADTGVKLAQSRLAVTTSEVAVAKSRVDLWVAENKYAQTGNDLDLLGVQVARIDLKVAQEQLALSRIRYQEELAAKDLLIAKQRLLNAETALEKDGTNERLLAQRDAADQQVKSQELINDRIRIAVDAQQEMVLQTQETQVQMKGMYDQLKTVQGALDQNTKSMGSLAGAADNAYASTKNLSGVASQVAGGFGQLSGAASTLVGRYSEIQRGSSYFGSTASSDTARVTSSFGGLGSAQSQATSRYGEMQSSAGQWASGAQTANAQVSEGFTEVGSKQDDIVSGYGDAAASTSQWASSSVDDAGKVNAVLDNLFSSTQTIEGGFGSMMRSSATWANSTLGDIDRVSGALKGLRTAQGNGSGNTLPPVTPAGNLTPSSGGSSGYGLGSTQYQSDRLKNFDKARDYGQTTAGYKYDSNGMRQSGQYQLPSPGDGYTFIPDQTAFGGTSPMDAAKGNYQGSGGGRVIVNGVGYWTKGAESAPRGFTGENGYDRAAVPWTLEGGFGQPPQEAGTTRTEGQQTTTVYNSEAEAQSAFAEFANKAQADNLRNSAQAAQFQQAILPEFARYGMPQLIKANPNPTLAEARAQQQTMDPTKTFKVVLSSESGQSVDAQVNSDDEQRLIAMLTAAARRTAA